MKTLGDDFMTYPEFEFWYMRFAQGNFDLDYDISLEPKKRKITDLPVEIFEKVGDSLYFEDRVNLRLVSKDIQLLVDEWNPKVSDFTYYDFNYWTIVQNSKFYQFDGWKRPNPLPAVVSILKNPKLGFKVLTVCQDSKWMKIEEELRKSSTKLHIVGFTLLNNTVYPIDLRLFCLGCLEEVSLSIDGEAVKRIIEFVNPEHCKRLKMLTIETDRCPSDFPPNSFVGYPRFTIECYEGYCAKRVAEFIKKLMKSTKLELGILECVPSSSDYHANWEPIKKYLSVKDTLVPDRPNIRRYPIRGSTDFFEINIEELRIYVYSEKIFKISLIFC
ncbi:hypothetical protein CRE_25938 [Caenorhabditis remanei]|uniref:F-box domain-containing protein n=1 Tax=Caenorhabditis remanei TaxID=31234 RepID=E3NK12_CAERE|nr:hypothetical protein CRE_25938 [Caenorhabditis remanei]